MAGATGHFMDPALFVETAININKSQSTLWRPAATSCRRSGPPANLILRIELLSDHAMQP